jgi:pimeloyl-ACP methyl ester carboxylesterase
MPIATTRDGTEIFYKQFGEGSGPVTVLMHGWPLSADTFDDVAVALAAKGQRVLSYDRRGFGRSDQPYNGYDYDSFSDDLADVLSEAGVEGPVNLVGFSMGGGEVARYASRHGADKIAKAVLIASVVPYMKKTPDNPDGTDQSVFDEMTAGMKKDRADFFRGFFKDFYGVGLVSHPVSDAVLDNSWRQAMMAGLHPTLKAAEAFSSTDFRPDLPSLTMPLLVIHGTADKTVPIDAAARAVKKALPHAQLIEYDGSAHGLTETDKDRLIADLCAFLV